MQIGFCLYKYFPFGGLQRDFLAVANECYRRGHKVSAYVLQWNGQKPDWLDVIVVPARAFSSHKRYAKYTQWLRDHRVPERNDLLIGFNKMPDLDVYFAADPCYLEKVSGRGRIYRSSGRCKHFLSFEDAVFSPSSNTQVLTIARNQTKIFQNFYQTPAERMHLLAPGIDEAYRNAGDRDIQRRQFRQEFDLQEDDILLLMVGSGFKTKGLDRALLAMAALPHELREKVRFFIIGQDNPKRFQLQAQKLGLTKQVTIFAGRSDVRRFMYGADLMLHPAYFESAGKVLIEALASALPILVTDVCGYAHYIDDAAGGCVLPSPFEQESLNRLLLQMLEQLDGSDWGESGLRFAQCHDLYSQSHQVVDIIEGLQQ